MGAVFDMVYGEKIQKSPERLNGKGGRPISDISSCG